MTALLPLYQIESELLELLALAEEPDLEPEAKEAIDKQITAYFAEVRQKTDWIAGTIRRCKSNAAIAREEAARLNSTADAWEAREKRIKDNALWAMQAHGVRLLETATNKLRVQKNGGLDPLEVYDQEAIPQSCKTVTLKLDWGTWELLGEVAKYLQLPYPMIELSNERLREALKRGPVAGTRLLNRGEHLRVE